MHSPIARGDGSCPARDGTGSSPAWPRCDVGFDVHLARRAADLGTRVLAITTREDSSLAAIADVVVAVPVQGSRQFGKSLFEQDPHAYKTMSRRHTNLEFRQ